ncbi:MAG TPA: CRTAC1 family protein [Thermoanaerobaculia bacterium]|nr:CRTAC1 family protein [Thermoanaerobaculia bacterium]
MCRRHPRSVAPGRRPPLLPSLVVALALALGAGCRSEPEAAGEQRQAGAEAAAAAGEPAEIFTDVAERVGLDFVHFNGMAGEFYTAEVTSAGCAFLDYDGDGDLDLYLVQGRMLPEDRPLAEAEFPPPEHMLPLADRLYRNDLAADGSFRLVDVTAAAGLAGEAGYGMGVATGDFDDDGWIDLYVTNLGENALLRNQGDGTFRDVTAAAGAGDERWSVPATFFDYDLDGRLDLFVGNYVEFSFDDDRRCFRVTGSRDYCGPMAYRESADRLFHNRGGGHFEVVTGEAGLNAAFGSALGAVAADLDGDGLPDLYVGNDGRPNQLWINQGDGTFVDEALLRGAAVNAAGFAEATMGVEIDDFDGDGDLDLFMTHLFGETNTLFVNEGGGMFTDRSAASGLGPASKAYTAFGVVALDYDNDGLLDFAVFNGEVRVIHQQAEDGVPFPLRQPNQLFRNLGGGRFEEVTEQAGASFQLLEVSRGAAVGDVDNDGDHDILLLNNNGPARLLLNNVGHRRHWLGLRMVGGEGPRDMLGTIVTLERPGRPPLVRRVHTDGSYASARDPRVLFGLGDSPEAGRVRARWPSGRVEQWDDLPADRYTTLREGSGR